jgi:hypothetical protein
MLLYDRLKRGRAERDLKNVVNSRNIIPKELLIELNKPGPDLSDAIKTMRPMKFKSPKKSVHDSILNQSSSDFKKSQKNFVRTVGSKNNQTIKKEVKNFGTSQDEKDQMMTSSIPENKQNKSTGDDSADNFNNERSKKISYIYFYY